MDSIRQPHREEHRTTQNNVQQATAKDEQTCPKANTTFPLGGNCPPPPLSPKHHKPRHRLPKHCRTALGARADASPHRSRGILRYRGCSFNPSLLQVPLMALELLPHLQEFAVHRLFSALERQVPQVPSAGPSPCHGQGSFLELAFSPQQSWVASDGSGKPGSLVHLPQQSWLAADTSRRHDAEALNAQRV